MTSRPFPTDIQTIRSFIMYDALAERDPFDGYKTFCEAIGNPNFEYTEYEFWYYRFYQGNLDLHYDRSLDSVQPKFDELPEEMLVGVMEQLDLKSRLITRKVSRKLRQLSHQTRQPVRIDYFGIKVSEDHIKLDDIKFEIDNTKMAYSENHIDYSNGISEHSKKFDYGEESRPFAINDFWTVMRIPRLEIGKLSISEFEENDDLHFVKDLQKAYECTTTRFHVAHFKTDSVESMTAMKILAFLEPEFLEKITLNVYDLENPEFDRLVIMEQFKKTKHIKICSSYLHSVHLHHFYHFQKFEIELRSIQPAEVVTLRDALASSAHFRACKIELIKALNLREVRQVLGIEENNVGSVIRQSQTLPNSQEYLHFRIDNKCIDIAKNAIERYRSDWPSDDED